MKKLVIALLLVSTIGNANAITSAQRVQILKYQKCVAQQVWFPWIVCVPPTFP